MRIPLLLALALAACGSAWAGTPPDPALSALSRDFFAWRVGTCPSTGDDLTRVERPVAWVPDWSPRSIEERRTRTAQFASRLAALDHTGWTLADSVDWLLLHSAISRVHYELDVLRSAARNPDFYTQQTLGPVFELLLQPPPFSTERAAGIVHRLESIPTTLSYARKNIRDGVGVFADIALSDLDGIGARLDAFRHALTPLLPRESAARFNEAVKKAASALEGYRTWLTQQRSSMKGTFVIGRSNYDWFLTNIALMPYSSADVVAIGKGEWERSVAFDEYESLRNAGHPPPAMFPSAEAQIAAEARDEDAIRAFLVERGILDVPPWIGHYRNQKLPPYLVPLQGLGVTDDLTSPSRPGENATSYILDPSPTLSFFRKSTAQDPRPIIVHEGVPGHFFQYALSWSHPDSIRRHYFDSGSCEGIGFYAEEMMLQMGLFDDKPGTRETIYRFMRLRALRVEVDVKLATGEFSIAEGARYLAATVPMDNETASGEAAFFATNPGQAISYQIGKAQIIRMIADAKIRQGERFILRDLHNFLWLNGFVPVALQRWEYLGARDEVDRILRNLSLHNSAH